MNAPQPDLGIQVLHGIRAAGYLALAGATLATLAGWLSWWWLPGELASHFRVQYFWICLFGVVALAATRHWYLAALAAAPMLLNLAVILPLYGPRIKPPDKSTALRVASINVHSGNRQHGKVVAFVRDIRPEVVLLLEITHDWRDALDELARDYPFQNVELRDDNFGIALFSRVELEDCRLREFGESDVPSIVAIMRISGQELTIVGTHPLPPARGDIWQLRNDQFAAIAKWCHKETGPLILIGDLNSTSWSAHFDTLLDGTRLRDSRTGFGVQPTWPAWSILPRIPINHALVSPEIEVRNRFIGPDIGSDHFPLVLDVVLPKRTAEQD